MKIFRYVNSSKTPGTIFTVLVFLLSLHVSCTKKVGQEPKAAVVTQCDTINYTEDIEPIIEKNCSLAGCHVLPNPTGNTMLNTYELLKAKGEAQRIKARVLDEVPSRMPPAGITPDQKKLIECWLNNGYQP